MDNIIRQYSGLGDVVFKVTKTRGIRISITHGPKIIVSFSKRYSLKKAEEFFNSRIIWVKNSFERMKKNQEIRASHVAKARINLSNQEILDKKHYIILRCRKLAEFHGFTIKKVILRNQKTIWGSCSHQNNISINLNLIYLKNELIDYVILHELVHTKIKNHSKRFWEELGKVLPEYERLDKELRSLSPLYL